MRLKAHLHYIRDLGPSIRVRARTQSKQVNSCLVFTLVRVRVRDFWLGRPSPSSSLHVAISSDADVRDRPRLCNAHAQSRLLTWSLPFCERATVAFCLIMMMSTMSTISSSRSQLSDADTEKLIHLVERRPYLYDVKDKRYKDAVMAKNAWQAIGAEVGIAGETINRPTCLMLGDK